MTPSHNIILKLNRLKGRSGDSRIAPTEMQSIEALNNSTLIAEYRVAGDRRHILFCIRPMFRG